MKVHGNGQSCTACRSACPYGVRYLSEDLNVVQKCTMCHDNVEKGELPACVRTCGGRARFFGDRRDREWIGSGSCIMPEGTPAIMGYHPEAEA